LFALGGLFVFVTLFLPKGILGTLTELYGRLRPARLSRRSEPKGSALAAAE
jgi:urea transport system permease protein